MRLPFVKMHGLGNDFVLLDLRGTGHAPDTAQYRRLADRRYGVGCDLILILTSANERRAQARCAFVNADGSVAEHCGNGVRCVARYLDRCGDSVERRVTLELDGALTELELGVGDEVRVDMGRPRFAPAAIPLAVVAEAPRYRVDIAGESHEFGAVSMGNPHAVFMVDDVSRAPLASVGPAVQDMALFPARVNAGFMQVVDRGHLRLRVFERGVGETRACGTGACAAVAVGRRWGVLDDSVEVELPGGSLRIAWDGTPDRPLWMTGPATFVFDGTIEL